MGKLEEARLMLTADDSTAALRQHPPAELHSAIYEALPALAKALADVFNQATTRPVRSERAMYNAIEIVHKVSGMGLAFGVTCLRTPNSVDQTRTSELQNSSLEPKGSDLQG